MTEKLKTILERFKKITLEAVVVRLLAAWAMMSVFQNLFSSSDFVYDAFFNQYTLLKSAAIFAVFFLFLCLPQLDRFIRYILLASFFFMFWLTLSKVGEFGYCIGACLIMIIICAYVLRPLSLEKDIKKLPSYVLTTVISVSVATFIAAVTIILYKAYWTPNFDFGIFSQMYYYLKETFVPYTTCERDGLLSHFAVHFSPVYYLLLPIYFVFPSPVTLLVMQSLITASGVIPLYLICKEHKFKNLSCFLVCVMYFGIPGIVGGNFYYFHENVFLTPFLLWLFYFAQKNKTIPTIVFSLLVMSVKEDAPIYIVFFGLYLLCSKKNIRLGAILSAIALLYFIIVTGCVEKFGDGAMFNRFNNFAKNGEQASMTGVILNVFRNPAYFISECFNNSKMEFFIQFFLPVLFLPFFTKHPSRLILLCPVVLVNLMSDYHYQHDMGYQYVFGPGAFVIFLTVLNLSDFDKLKRQKLCITAALCSALVFSSMFVWRANYISSYGLYMDEHDSISAAMELIPDNASVAASTFFVANLSQRDEIYEVETTKHTAEYYVIDMRGKDETYIAKYTGTGYAEIYRDEYIAIYRNLAYGV